MSMNHVVQKTLNTCWHIPIPKMYIHTSTHRALRLHTSSRLLEQVKDGSWTLVETACGHSPFLSHVDECVNILTGFAS